MKKLKVFLIDLIFLKRFMKENINMKLVAEMTAKEKEELVNIYPSNWSIEDIILDRYQNIEVRVIDD